MDPNTILVRAREKFPLSVVVGHDRACDGQSPPGKPILEPPGDGRVIIQDDEVFRVAAYAAYSCKDSPGTPEILATGNVPYYVVAEGQPGAGQFVRKDKVERA